jgi:hypothetical protein
VRERQDANRTREAGHLDEIQGVVAITLNLFRNGAVGFIEWLDGFNGVYSCALIHAMNRVAAAVMPHPAAAWQRKPELTGVAHAKFV